VEKSRSQQKLLQSKTQIRQEISLLKIPNKSVRDKNLIKELYKFNYKIILGFLPIKSEPEIIQFLSDRNKSGTVVGLPVIIDNGIIFKPYNNSYTIGKFGLLEPDTEQIIDLAQEEILCITPLVACTADGIRLGRGGGYYDRFFAKYKNIFKVGICYKEQVLEYLPTESHDIKLDRIIYS